MFIFLSCFLFCGILVFVAGFIGFGAGYAGGIVSSAIDGMEAVKRIAGQI